jgi:hypothetical protein
MEAKSLSDLVRAAIAAGISGTAKKSNPA